MSGGARAGADLGGDAGADGGLGHRQVVRGLEVQPELGRGAEIAGKTEGRVRADGARVVGGDDGGDAVRRDVQIACERVSAEAEGDHKFLVEDFAGMGANAGHGGGSFSDNLRF